MQSFKKFCQLASNLTESSPEYYRLSHDLERFRSLVRSSTQFGSVVNGIRPKISQCLLFRDNARLRRTDKSRKRGKPHRLRCWLISDDIIRARCSLDSGKETPTRPHSICCSNYRERSTTGCAHGPLLQLVRAACLPD